MKYRHVCRKTIILGVVILFLGASMASSSIYKTEKKDMQMIKDDTSKDVAVLKWMGAHGTFEDYTNNRETNPFIVTEIGGERNSGDNPLIIVFVNSNLLPHIQDDITLYCSTLENVGYDIVLLEVSGGTAEDLKDQLLLYWTDGYDVKGAVLIGDMPVAWFHHEWDFDGNSAEFPCDLFLMDLDGEWIYSETYQMYLDHVNGEGDTAPEIYVGRIDASKVTGDEITITQEYLHKVHDFWIGNTVHSDFGLTYTDHDWIDSDDIKFNMGYAYDDFEAVWWDDVNRNDYVNNRLPDETYEFIQLACHSSTWHHVFHTGGDAWASAIRNAPPRALFYNLFCCGSLRFTDNNIIGNAYIMNTATPSLSVVGSTKSGSMLHFRDFYEPIGQGNTFGDAFQQWFESQAPYSNYPDGYNDVSWFYGMTILGDPTLIPNPPREVYVDDDYYEGSYNDGHIWGIDAFNTILSGVGHVVDGGTVYVKGGEYEENIPIRKSIEIIGVDGKENTFVDGGLSQCAFYINNVLDGVTIRGFTITNCPIAGIYLDYSGNCVIKDNTLINNVGYGVKSWYSYEYGSENHIYHNNFINNNAGHAYDGPLVGPQYPNWDNGYGYDIFNPYVEGGNYWEGYVDEDEYNGPDQVWPGSDGIWDSMYVIPGEPGHAYDRYPFTIQDGWVPTPDPGWSYMILTDEGDYPGLNTCYCQNAGVYQYLKVTCLDGNGQPIEDIPAGHFQFNINPYYLTEWYGMPDESKLTCRFIPIDQETNEVGEIRFEIRDNTSIRGLVEIQGMVNGVILFTTPLLSCKSYDLTSPPDGDVDVSDFGIFASHYHSNYDGCDYDWSGGSPSITIVDFTLFGSHFHHR